MKYNKKVVSNNNESNNNKSMIYYNDYNEIAPNHQRPQGK